MHALVILLLLSCAAVAGLTATVALAWIGRPRHTLVDLEAETAADPVFSTVTTSGWVRPQA